MPTSTQGVSPYVEQLRQSLSSKNERNQQTQFTHDERLISSKVKTQLESQEQILIRRKVVERLTALSRSRIYDLMSRGEFPLPVRLGAKSVAWIHAEVYDWIAARVADRGRSVGGDEK